MMLVVNLAFAYKADWIWQMSVLVEQQDEVVNAVEAQAETVSKDVETGCVPRCITYRA